MALKYYLNFNTNIYFRHIYSFKMKGLGARPQFSERSTCHFGLQAQQFCCNSFRSDSTIIKTKFCFGIYLKFICSSGDKGKGPRLKILDCTGIVLIQLRWPDCRYETSISGSGGSKVLFKILFNIFINNKLNILSGKIE